MKNVYKTMILTKNLSKEIKYWNLQQILILKKYTKKLIRMSIYYFYIQRMKKYTQLMNNLLNKFGMNQSI